MTKARIFDKFKDFTLRFTLCYTLEIKYKEADKTFIVNYGAYKGQGMHEFIVKSEKQTREYSILEIPKKYQKLVNNMCELARKNQF